MAPNSSQSDIGLYVAIAIAIVVIIITFLFSRRFRKSINVVLLIGLSDAGKTAIFTKIMFNKPKKSVTSLKENEGTNHDLNLKLIDLPGADRLRNRYWEQFRNKANHIVFVLDSTAVDSKLRDLSEYLYAILSDSVVHKNKMMFTITCHKQDLDEAKSIRDIKSVLEKELNAIRDTKKGQLGKTSEEEEEDYLVHKDISFDALRVKFIETSSSNIDQLIKLII